MVRKVTLVDATLIEAPTKPPSRGNNPLEEEASFTVKTDKPHYGYKANLASEAATGMIKAASIQRPKRMTVEFLRHSIVATPRWQQIKRIGLELAMRSWANEVICRYVVGATIP